MGNSDKKKMNERTRSRAMPQLKKKLSKCQNVRKKGSEKKKGKPRKDQRHSVEDQRRHLVDKKKPSKDARSPKRLFPEDLTLIRLGGGLQEPPWQLRGLPIVGV